MHSQSTTHGEVRPTATRCRTESLLANDIAMSNSIVQQSFVRLRVSAVMSLQYVLAHRLNQSLLSIYLWRVLNLYVKSLALLCSSCTGNFNNNNNNNNTTICKAP